MEKTDHVMRLPLSDHEMDKDVLLLSSSSSRRCVRDFDSSKRGSQFRSIVIRRVAILRGDAGDGVTLTFIMHSGLCWL